MRFLQESYARFVVFFLFFIFLSHSYALSQTEGILFTDCAIYSMETDDVIEDGFAFIQDGVIRAFGQGSYTKSVAKTVSLPGHVLMPGFIDLHRESIPKTEALTELYRSGITLIAVRPVSDSLFGGWSKVVQLLPDSLGGLSEIESQLDYQINLHHKVLKHKAEDMYDSFQQKRNLYRLRQVFSAGEAQNNGPVSIPDQVRSHAESHGVFYFYTHSLNELLLLSRLIAEQNLQGYFGGANHISELMEITRNYETEMIVLGPSMFTRHNRFNDHYVEPARLSEVGHKFAMATFYPTETWMSLLDQVRLLTSYGITEFDALSSVTRNPGELIKKAGTYGVIKEGAKANLVVFNGNPADIRSEVTMLIINGKVIDLR